MDTLTTTTTITSTHGTITIISSLLTPLEWVSLFFGFVMYWLKKLDEVRVENHEKPIKEYLKLFAKDNWIEVPTSALSCVVLALIGSELPPTIIVMKGVFALFCVGYANSSILNRVITKTKTKIQTQKINVNEN